MYLVRFYNLLSDYHALLQPLFRERLPVLQTILFSVILFQAGIFKYFLNDYEVFSVTWKFIGRCVITVGRRNRVFLTQ